MDEYRDMDFGSHGQQKKKPAQDIHKGHRDRLRAKYIKNGAAVLEDHELLEMLLFYCIPRRDTNALAHRMLEQFGGLHNILEASPADISKHCEVSINTAVLISLCLPMYKRYEIKKWNKRVKLDSSVLAGGYVKNLFTGETCECVYIVCLDVQKQLIHHELICRGTIDEVQMYPRTIVEAALKYKAACVILAHNHPSGVLSASKSDINATTALKNAFEPIGIELLDHIIVSGSSYLSFAAKKLLSLSY